MKVIDETKTLKRKIEQLQDELETLNTLNQQNLKYRQILQNQICKAIEYIENTYEKEYHKPKEEIKNFNLKNCTYEPSLVVLGILKGEENENN